MSHRNARSGGTKKEEEAPLQPLIQSIRPRYPSSLLTASVDSIIENEVGSIMAQLRRDGKGESSQWKTMSKLLAKGKKEMASGSQLFDRSVVELKNDSSSPYDNASGERERSDGNDEPKTRWQRLKRDSNGNREMRRKERMETLASASAATTTPRRTRKKKTSFQGLEPQSASIFSHQPSSSHGKYPAMSIFEPSAQNFGDVHYPRLIGDNENQLNEYVSRANSDFADGAREADTDRETQEENDREVLLKYLKKQEKQRKRELDEEKARMEREELERLRRQKEEDQRRKREMQEEEERKKLQELKRRHEFLREEERKRKTQFVKDLFVQYSSTLRFKRLNRYFAKWKLRIRPMLIREREINFVIYWRMLGKFFRLWHGFVELQREMRDHERERKKMMEVRRLEEAANAFLRKNVFHRYLNTWYLCFKVHRERRLIQEVHEHRRQHIERALRNLSRSQQPIIPSSNNGLASATMVEDSEVSEHLHDSRAQRTRDDILGKGSAEWRDTLSSKKEDEEEVAEESPSTSIPFSSVEPVSAVDREPSLGRNRPRQDLKDTCHTPSSQGKTRVSRKRSNSSPQFLVSMEERAKARRERWEQLQQKYREAEEEKRRQTELEEIQFAEEDLKKQRDLAEKRRRERELQQQKLRDREERKRRYERNVQQAELHYPMSVMKFYGWIPWRRLVLESNERIHIAEHFHSHNTMQRMLERWKRFIVVTRMTPVIKRCAQVAQVRQHTRQRLLRSTLHSWFSILAFQKLQMKIAMQHYDEKLCTSILACWKLFVRIVRVEKQQRLAQLEYFADRQAKRFTMRFFFDRWNCNIREQKIEREKQVIGESLLSKVDVWLSDFRKQKNFTDW